MAIYEYSVISLVIIATVLSSHSFYNYSKHRYAKMPSDFQVFLNVFCIPFSLMVLVIFIEYPNKIISIKEIDYPHQKFQNEIIFKIASGKSKVINKEEFSGFYEVTYEKFNKRYKCKTIKYKDSYRTMGYY